PGGGVDVRRDQDNQYASVDAHLDARVHAAAKIAAANGGTDRPPLECSPMVRLLLLLLAAASVGADQKPKPAPGKPPAAARPAPFVNPYTLDEIRNKQAVIETTAGTIVLDLLADAAPT